MTQKIKNIQRNDRTKEWSLEMERSIQSIMSNNKEGNKKNYEKSLVDCKKQETKYMYFHLGATNWTIESDSRKSRERKNGRS